MNRFLTRFLALLLTLCLMLALLPTLALAQENSPTAETSTEQDERGRGRRTPERPSDNAAEKAAHKTTPRTALPAYYNSNTLGYITPVRNQGSYGTCWAHGAIASCEAYMIKYGIRYGIFGTSGATATTALNLSEYHLAWFGYTDAYDKLGMLAGDKTLAASNYLNLGGFGEIPSYTLMRWEGLTSEATSALVYNRANANGLSSVYAYDYNVAHVEDCVWIPTSDINGVKQAIMDYGAGTFGYYSSGGSQYENENTGAYYYPSSQDSDHDVTVVGWDDNYSRNNFVTKPSANGAWIIKNSWGTNIGDNGYYYISYYDVPSSEDTCYFYKVGPVDNYDNNYQYDGTTNFSNYTNLRTDGSIANVFTAKGTELLKAVAFCNWDADMAYQVDIYQGCTTGNPTSGTKVSSQTGTFEYAGYHTVTLTTPVALAKGDTFSVVFTNKSATEKAIPLDRSNAVANWVTWTHSSPDNVSYSRSSSYGSWSNSSSSHNYRIKAYTENYTPIVLTATPNNTAWGTVSVTGMRIYATPADGYYASGYTILSGNPTVTQNGNTFMVSATEDCSIRIDFALKTACTITFTGATDTVHPIEAYTGDAVTMPTAAGFITGYSFIGWTAAAVTNSAAQPDFYAPGSTSYIASGNATLLALYSYVQGGTTYYTTAPSACAHNWAEADRLDASCTEGGTLLYRCSLCGSEKYEDLPALGHDIVTDEAVAPTCLASGLSAGSHCSRCDAATTAQTVIDALGHDIVADEAVAPTCLASGLSAGSHCSRCDAATTAQTVIDALGHDIVADEAVAPTCLASGLSAGSHCSRCDAATTTQTVLEALGHAWDAGLVTTAPTATEDGVKTFTCTRCGETKIEAIPKGEDEKPCDGGADCPGRKFTDMPKVTNWAHAGIDFALKRELFNGTSDTTFAPDGDMTRAMLVTVLWRLDGKPAPTGGNPFSDVPDSKWYTDAVIWAAENQIVNGVGNGKFDPEGNVTREQMAAILYRYAGKKGYDTSKQIDLSGYPDANQISGFAKDALSWANAEGLINGSDGKLQPKGNATRAQVAAILMRYVNNIVKA